jgi:ribosomal protein S18 acetylase RimI-like enzyme
LTVAAYEAAGLLENDAGYSGELRDAAGRAAADRTDLLVAVDAATGEIVGSVTFVLPGSPLAELCMPTEAEFRMLAVAPAARGRGVGELLVRACVDRAREHGCEGMVISVSTISRPAHRLYPRLGFRRVPARDWRPHPHYPLLAYELAL